MIMSAETIGDDIPKRVRREDGSLPMPGQRVSSAQHRSFSAEAALRQAQGKRGP
ncbi:MAG: hypothetical protein OTJ97_03995 [SAR202 cluster bacterium]|nr:hypothetical protein [SAR202 cluster bacterium]